MTSSCRPARLACMILLARSSSRRWMMYTLLPYLVRKWASSMAGRMERRGCIRDYG